MLAVAGDDHACKSSTLPSQSEFAFQDFEMPVLAPADVQEVLDYGLLGYAHVALLRPLGRADRAGRHHGFAASPSTSASTATSIVLPEGFAHARRAASASA